MDKPAEQLNLYEAKTHLSALVERAAKGESFIIAKAGRPLARLVPLEAPKRNKITFGGMEGQFVVPDDFDDELPEDLLALFEGGDDPDWDMEPSKKPE